MWPILRLRRRALSHRDRLMHLKRIGIFGGTFDPFHLGHFLVARAAIEEANLERLFLVPAARSPFKPEGKSTDDSRRLKWLRLALQGETNCSVDTQELKRGGVSFAIDTVTAYHDAFPQAKLFYLIGADHVPTLYQWREASQLARLVTFLIVPRPGQQPTALKEPFLGQFLKGFPLGVSSSIIRDRIRRGFPISGLVHPKVEEDIVNCPISG